MIVFHLFFGMERHNVLLLQNFFLHSLQDLLKHNASLINLNSIELDKVTANNA